MPVRCPVAQQGLIGTANGAGAPCFKPFMDRSADLFDLQDRLIGVGWVGQQAFLTAIDIQVSHRPAPIPHAISTSISAPMSSTCSKPCTSSMTRRMSGRSSTP
jgi:hypothetical protein